MTQKTNHWLTACSEPLLHAVWSGHVSSNHSKVLSTGSSYRKAPPSPPGLDSELLVELSLVNCLRCWKHGNQWRVFGLRVEMRSSFVIYFHVFHEQIPDLNFCSQFSTSYKKQIHIFVRFADFCEKQHSFHRKKINFSLHLCTPCYMRTSRA
jgi:hypothetical protein